MKLSETTIQLLKGFSQINQSICIVPGNRITTATTQNSIVAAATVPETFEQQLAIYDLPQFLSILSMFSDPTIDLSGGRQARVYQGKTVVGYTFAEPSMIARAPNGVKDLPATARFELPATTLQSALKAVSVMALPELAIRGDGRNLYLTGCDSKNSATNKYDADIGETEAIFTAYLKVESLKIAVRDYRVDVNERFVKLVAIDDRGPADLTYWLAIQQHSKFN